MNYKPYCLIILALSMICLVSVGYMAEDSQGAGESEDQGTFGNGMTWTYNNGTLTISGDNSIPDYSSYSYVPWAQYRNSITTVTILSGVTSIGDYSFYNHTRLSGIDIPSTVRTIGNYSFGGCSTLSEITIPSNVSSIGTNAFSGCTGLRSIIFNSSNCTDFSKESTPFSSVGSSQGVNVTIGSGVKKIPAYIFYSNSKIKTISVSTSVVTYGDYCFYGCTSLKTLEISNAATTIGKNSFSKCTSINKIEYNAARLSNYQKTESPFSNIGTDSTVILDVGSSVKSIPNYAFAGNIAITEVSFPSGLQSLGKGCFENCTGLTSLTIPSELTSMDETSFSGCSEIETISYNARSLVLSSNISPFSNMNATANVTFRSGVTTIPDHIFDSCRSFTFDPIPSSVTTIGKYPFSNISNKVDLSNANGIRTLSEYSFYNTNICLTLTSSVTEIPKGAFQGCTGTLVIPDNNKLVSIGQNAFQNCSSLSSITLNNTLTNLGEGAFSGCSSLKTIDYKATKIASLDRESHCFDVSSNARTEITFNCVTIPDYILYNNDAIDKVMITNNVQNVGSYAFYNFHTNVDCISFENESFELKKIGVGAFEKSNIHSLYIGPSIVMIDAYAFYDCPITDVYYNNSLFINPLEYVIKSSNDSGFMLHVADGIDEIPGGLFKNTNVSEIDLNGVKRIGKNSFENTSLKTLSLPITVEEIGESAFALTPSLKDITFDNFYTEIGNKAFYIEGSDVDTYITCYRKAIQNDYNWYNDNRDIHFKYIHLEGEYDGMMEVIFNLVSPIIGMNATNVIIDFFIDSYSLKAIESIDLGSEFNNQLLLISIAALLILMLFMMLYFDRDEHVRIIESVLTFIAIIIILYSSLRKILIHPESLEIAVTISVLLIVGMYVPIQATVDSIKTKRNPKEGEHLVTLYTLDMDAYKKTVIQPWITIKNMTTVNFKENPFKALLLITIPGGIAHSVVYSVTIVLVHIPAIIFSRIIALMFTTADLNTNKHTNDCVCSECGYRFHKPIYVCSDCGVEHGNIAPGKYGVHECVCECGNRIPCTVGKKRWMHSEQRCPNCSCTIRIDESEPFAIMMVGSSGSGKTTMMVESAKHFINDVAGRDGFTIDEDCSWRIIEECQQRGYDSATTSKHIITYALKFDSQTKDRAFKTPKSIYYYDVGGAVYSSSKESTLFDGMLNGLEGIIFTINPNDIAEYAIRNGKIPNEDNDSNLVFSNFSSIYSNNTGTGPTEKIDVPLALVITRCEEAGLQNGLECDNNGTNPISDFLEENGLYNLVNEVSLRFTNVRYYSVDSSLNATSSSFAPIRWFIHLQNKKMIGRIE